MSAPPPRAIVLDPEDDVATALAAVAEGAEVVLTGAREGRVRAAGHVPFGHKIALRDLAAGAVVRKYGEPVGRASQAIGIGAHVHRHNLAGERGRGR